jgi:hypothetical protein
MCSTVGILLLTLLNPDLSHVLVLSCIPFVLTCILYGFYHCPEKPWGILKQCLGFTFAAFCCWIPDKFYCKEATEFFMGTIGFYPQLHAIWHLLTNCLMWTLIMTGAKVRFISDKKKMKTTYDSYFGVYPFVSIV